MSVWAIPLLRVRVGTLVTARRAIGPVAQAGERGVCYQVYVLDNRPGYGILFRRGG
jgi:hypothetical protein